MILVIMINTTNLSYFDKQEKAAKITIFIGEQWTQCVIEMMASQLTLTLLDQMWTIEILHDNI